MSSAIRLYLVRHGRTHWNHIGRFQGYSDVPLDDVGRAQVTAFAESVRGQQVEAIIASDLLRASQSAQIVAEILEIPLLCLDADLRERGYGVFEGLTREECSEQHPLVWAAREANRNFEPPGGEPNAQVIARMWRGLTNAAERIRGRYQRGLVIGHGSSMRMFFESLTGVPGGTIGNTEMRVLVHDLKTGFSLER